MGSFYFYLFIQLYEFVSDFCCSAAANVEHWFLFLVFPFKSAEEKATRNNFQIGSEEDILCRNALFHRKATWLCFFIHPLGFKTCEQVVSLFPPPNICKYIIIDSWKLPRWVRAVFLQYFSSGLALHSSGTETEWLAKVTQPILCLREHWISWFHGLYPGALTYYHQISSLPLSKCKEFYLTI